MKARLNNYRIKCVVLVSIMHSKKSYKFIIAVFLRKVQVSTDVLYLGTIIIGHNNCFIYNETRCEDWF